MTSDEPAAPGAGRRQGGPPPFDTSVAHQARIYDYLLGGKDNYAADRAAVEAALKVAPEMGFTARANRAFLGRAVRYLAAEAGIRQFLDIGTGIPTAGNTHQVAQAIAPESRVVYVDYDPVVLAHARALLTSSEAGATEYIDADLRDTGTILDAGRASCSTSPSRSRSRCSRSCTRYRTPTTRTRSWPRLMDAVPSGSYLAAVPPGVGPPRPGDAAGASRTSSRRMIQQQYIGRTREQVARFFEGTDLVEPGLVPDRGMAPGARQRQRLASRPCGARWAASAEPPVVRRDSISRLTMHRRSTYSPCHDETTVADAGADLLRAGRPAGGPLHGYAIMKRAEELSGGRVRLATGTLYTALDRLTAEG